MIAAAKRAVAVLARTALVASIAFGVTSCGGGDDGIEPPAELVPFEADIDVRRLWNTKAGGKSERLRLGLMPSTDGASIFVASWDGRVQALDAETGRARWTARLEDNLTAGPAFGRGTLVLGTANGNLVALDAQNGELRWEREAGNEILAPPAIGQNAVVFRTIDGRLRAFSLATGADLWSVEQSLPALTLRGDAAPVVSGQVVVSGFDNGRIGAYDLGSGTPFWEIPIASSTGRNELERLVDIGSGLAVVGNDVYTAGINGRAVSIDLRSGQVAWQQEISSYAGLGVDVNNVYVSDEFGTVTAFDRRLGAPLWRQEALRLRDVTAPARFGNVLVVGDFEGYLHWLDPQDGHFRARVKAASDRIAGPPLVVGQTLFVQSDDGSVSAYVLRGPDA